MLADVVMFRTFIVVFVHCCLISVYSGSSAGMPPCDNKETCNDLWNTPTISDCINGTCQCTGGSVYVEKNIKCECQEEYVVGSKKCLPVTTALELSCEEDVQCSKLGDLAVCDNYQCYCKSGSTPVNGKCETKKYIGETCQTEEECQHIKNAGCRDNTCTCVEGHVPNTDAKMCLPLLTNFWSACVEDIQCHQSFGEGSRCLTKCVCKNDYHIINNSECVRNKGMGQECSSSKDCYIETDVYSSRVSCDGGICGCKSGYHFSSDHRDCLPGTGGSLALKPMSYQVQIFIMSLITCLKLVLQ